jgi:hypothetical protein
VAAIDADALARFSTTTGWPFDGEPPASTR